MSIFNFVINIHVNEIAQDQYRKHYGLTPQTPAVLPQEYNKETRQRTHNSVHDRNKRLINQIRHENAHISNLSYPSFCTRRISNGKRHSPLTILHKPSSSPRPSSHTRRRTSQSRPRPDHQSWSASAYRSVDPCDPSLRWDYSCWCHRSPPLRVLGALSCERSWWTTRHSAHSCPTPAILNHPTCPACTSFVHSRSWSRHQSTALLLLVLRLGSWGGSGLV